MAIVLDKSGNNPLDVSYITTLLSDNDSIGLIANGWMQWQNPPVIGYNQAPVNAGAAGPDNWYFGPGGGGTIKVYTEMDATGRTWVVGEWLTTTTSLNTIEYPGSNMQDVVEHDGFTHMLEGMDCTVRVYFTIKVPGWTPSSGARIVPKLGVSTGIRMWQGGGGQIILAGDYCQNFPYYYQAPNAGTTGNTIPSHLSGTVSDGNMLWTFKGPAKGNIYDVYEAFSVGLASSAPAPTRGAVKASTGVLLPGGSIIVGATEMNCYADFRIPPVGFVNSVDYANTIYPVRTLLPPIDIALNTAGGGSKPYIGFVISTTDVLPVTGSKIKLTDVWDKLLVAPTGFQRRRMRRFDELIRNDFIPSWRGGTNVGFWQKGDILVGQTENYFGTTGAVHIGANNAILRADSAQASGVKWDNDGFTAYSPAIAAVSGTITTLGTTIARYKVTSKIMTVSVSFVITTNGTGAQFIIVNLPAGFTAASIATLHGRALVSGKALQALVQAASASFWVYDYAGLYPGASGETITFSGDFEIT